MVNDTYDNSNIFAKILDGEIPSYKIFETDHVLAILDAFPTVPGHALLIPKARGYVTIMDMPEDIAANVCRELPRLAKMVQKATGCDGVNIVQNNGPAAGQVVMHVHIHVIPRYQEDKLIHLPAGKQMIEKEDALNMLAKLQAAL